MFRARVIAVVSAFLGGLMLLPAWQPEESVIWRFDQIDRIGGQFIVSSAKGAGTRIRIILNKAKDSENPQKTGDA